MCKRCFKEREREMTEYTIIGYSVVNGERKVKYTDGAYGLPERARKVASMLRVADLVAVEFTRRGKFIHQEILAVQEDKPMSISDRTFLVSFLIWLRSSYGDTIKLTDLTDENFVTLATEWLKFRENEKWDAVHGSDF